MDYKIIIERAWRCRHVPRGELAPGSYAVPEHLSHGLAQLAIAQGMAHRIDPPPADAPAEPKPKRGRRKTAAPQNKLARAQENKQALV